MPWAEEDSWKFLKVFFDKVFVIVCILVFSGGVYYYLEKTDLDAYYLDNGNWLAQTFSMIVSFMSFNKHWFIIDIILPQTRSFYWFSRKFYALSVTYSHQ